MNRKSKLIFSLVSLCFSIAVLCFGVYSAIQVSYTVSGSVSYEVTDAFVEITTNVYASSERMEQSALNSNAQNLEDPTYVNTYTKVGQTYTYNSMEELSETNQPQANGIDINYNNYCTYFIVINIKNLSSDVNIYALIEEGIIGTELNSNVYKTRYQNGIIKPQTSDNVGKNIVLGFSLNDATTGVNAEFDYTLNVSTGDYEPQAAVIDVVALDNTNIVTNANFDGSSYTFEITSDSASHMTIFGYTTWLYNITLENIDIEYYNALLITASTDQVIFGIGVIDRHITQDDDPLDFVTGLVQEADTFASSMSISSTTQQLCFGIATEDVIGIHSTVTLTFTNQIIDEENKLKFTQINNGTELSVSALDETISGVVTIPSTYNGLPVTQIESGAASNLQDKHVDGFAYCDNITAIIIPETVREIAGSALYSCSALKTVTFKDNSQLESIGEDAFRSCSKLTSIEIPSSVTSIGSLAFDDCSALGTVTFGENSQLGSIGDYAFRSCSNLTSIEIPSSVTSIGDHAFDGCSALATVTFGVNSQLGSIGDYAFRSCSNLTSIKIPSGVTSIGSSAFYNCLALKTVTFEENSQLESIGDWAFYYCSSLTSIEIPSSVTSIGANAFRNCSNLTSIEIPSSVTSIGEDAFYGTSWLTNLQNTSYGIATASDGQTRFVIEVPTDITDDELDMTNVKVIVGYAFYNCSNLTSIEIPSSVKSIGDSAFSGCNKLENITVDPSNANYCSDEYGVLFNKDKTELIQYPVGNTRTQYTIPSSVASIGEYAFNSCSALETVTFGEGSKLESIGSYAFSHCSNLTSIKIPSSVTSIGDYAFSYCSNLTSITISSSVTSIGYYAFYSCEKLESIAVDPNNANYCNDEYGVLFNKDKTELIQYPVGNTRTQYTIPSSVTSIGYSAFSNCSNLTSIEIPSSVKSIGNSAFRSCDALETVIFGENSQLESIGDYVFSDCSSLTSIEIPSSVTSIGNGAFSACSNLTSIEIPSSVTSIGSAAFQYCSALKIVTFEDTVTEWTVTRDSTSKTITSQDLLSPSTMATYLRSTYYNYTWTKKQ